MFKPWVKYTLFGFATLLFLVNIIIIVHKDSNISRLQIIDQFVSANVVDIVESTEKPGVISTSSEEFIYVNESLGSIDSIFVEVGQEIQAGDALFNYTNLQIDSAKNELELKIEQVT
ncbi:hypothetical protein [Halalkalibacter akibai]|uniref:YknX-like barrel-sandwich hybrid domain-containing protein n=1 Tax=Halalkalibacter akibai (strain ATCC 43226 / DSM 21942 / CIP 109018 / JCM 9157 / 1139) TaxID=1236973 RepID=W4QPU7_HALA3|nr:hypothetical protein [Halalkalibacter akibai]GAE33688.1 hypothetical protein JCM9157_709 [Halalkalibacter akibai JCM 9157]